MKNTITHVPDYSKTNKIYIPRKGSVQCTLIIPIIASLLTACGSSGGSDGNIDSLSQSEPSSSSIDIESLIQNSDGTFRSGYFYPNGSVTSAGIQIGDLFVVEGKANHIVVDLETGKTRFYEVQDSDYHEVATYSGTGSLSFDSYELTWDNYMFGEVIFEKEPSIYMAFQYDDQKVFPDTNSIERISNTYIQKFGVYPNYVNISITIDESGLLTGATDSGCVFNGSVEVPRSANNAYYIEADISNCEEEGSYKGFGYLESHTSNGATFLNLHLFSSDYALFFKMNA